MGEKDATDEEDLKRYWYNRWKYGFSWFEMANTLKTGAYNTHDVFLVAVQRFLKDFWENAEVKKEGDTLQIKGDLSLTPPDPEMDMYRVYMGQAGSAIENLLKGIIICGMWLDKPESIDGVDDFKMLSFPVKGSDQTMTIKKHDLIALLSAKNMSLTFSDEEKEILKKLSHFIIWASRFTSSVKYDSKDEPSFMKTMAPYDEPHEHEVIDKIYQKAKAELFRLSSLQRDKQD
jgi:hypothetical protein